MTGRHDKKKSSKIYFYLKKDQKKKESSPDACLAPPFLPFNVSIYLGFVFVSFFFN